MLYIYLAFENCRKSMINGTGIKALCMQEFSVVYINTDKCRERIE